MKQTIEDKLVSKVSKGKLNTIHVSREEMADLESHKKRNPF